MSNVLELRNGSVKRIIFYEVSDPQNIAIWGGESGSAYSPFGPVKAGLITTQRTKEDQALTELLNCLESKMLEANIKSLKVLDMLINDTLPRAGRGVSS